MLHYCVCFLKSDPSEVYVSVAPIIGSAIGYRPIIGVVMPIDISGAFPYQFFSFFDLVVFSKHESLTCSAHK